MRQIQEGKQIADIIFSQCWPADSHLASFDLHLLSVAPKRDRQIDRIVGSPAERGSPCCSFGILTMTAAAASPLEDTRSNMGRTARFGVAKAIEEGKNISHLLGGKGGAGDALLRHRLLHLRGMADHSARQFCKRVRQLLLGPQAGSLQLVGCAQRVTSDTGFLLEQFPSTLRIPRRYRAAGGVLPRESV